MKTSTKLFIAGADAEVKKPLRSLLHSDIPTYMSSAEYWTGMEKSRNNNVLF